MRISRNLALVANKKHLPASTQVTFGSLQWHETTSGSVWNVPYIGKPSGYREKWVHIVINVIGRPAKINYVRFSGYKQSITSGSWRCNIRSVNSTASSGTIAPGGTASISWTDYNGNWNTNNAAGFMKCTFSNCVLPVGTYWLWVDDSASAINYFGNGNNNFKLYDTSWGNG